MNAVKSDTFLPDLIYNVFPFSQNNKIKLRKKKNFYFSICPLHGTTKRQRREILSYFGWIFMEVFIRIGAAFHHISAIGYQICGGPNDTIKCNLTGNTLAHRVAKANPNSKEKKKTHG